MDYGLIFAVSVLVLFFLFVGAVAYHDRHDRERRPLTPYEKELLEETLEAMQAGIFIHASRDQLSVADIKVQISGRLGYEILKHLKKYEEAKALVQVKALVDAHYDRRLEAPAMLQETVIS